MSASLQGLVSLAFDPDAGTCITPEWVASARELGAGRVRIPIRADSHNQLPLELVKRSVSTWIDGGVEVDISLAEDLNRPWLEPGGKRMFYPDEAPGYEANLRQNRWILDTCRRAHDVAKALVPLGVTQFSVYNEPNLLAELPIGANVPPVAGPKAPALAPAAFGSLAYEMAGYLHDAGATLVEFGAFSWIAGSGPDAHNPYCSEYITKALQYLRTTGVTAPVWEAVSLNVEGNWSVASVADAVAAIDKAVAVLGWKAPALVLGEWGVENRILHVPSAQTTYSAWSLAAEQMHLYAHQITADGYGCQGYGVSGTRIVPTGTRTPWWTAYKQMVAPASIVA